MSVRKQTNILGFLDRKEYKKGLGKSDLKSYTIFELLGYFSSVLDELKQRGVVRTRNNPVADYAEWLTAKSLSLSLEPNSRACYDAIDSKKERFQIKCRRLDPKNVSRQLSVIRNLEINGFDYLIGILFENDFKVKEAYKIPYHIIKKYSRFSKHQNGYLLNMRGKLLMDPEVEDVTEILLKNQSSPE